MSCELKTVARNAANEPALGTVSAPFDTLDNVTPPDKSTDESQPATDVVISTPTKWHVDKLCLLRADGDVAICPVEKGKCPSTYNEKTCIRFSAIA